MKIIDLSGDKARLMSSLDAGHIELPLSPSVNRLYRLHPTSRSFYKAPEAIEYKQRIKPLFTGFNSLSDPILIRAFIYFERRSGDLDNREKILFDSLEGLLYVNDRQIAGKKVLRLLDRDNPRIELYWRFLPDLYLEHIPAFW